MKNIKKLSLLYGLVLAIFLLAACSGTSSEESAFPTGRFALKQNEQVLYQFNEDQTWAFISNGVVAARGAYEIDGNQWIEQGTAECPFTGTYEWSFDGTNLSFKLVGEDECDPRRQNTNSRTFTLVVPESAAAPDNMPTEVVAEIAAIPEIRIDSLDYSYTAPASISAGWVRVILSNSGAEPHHIQFLRLNDGVSFEQFQEALALGEGPALALVQQMGGVGAIAPTLTAQAVLNLTAGEYAILCFVPSPSDHVPHLAKGMLQSITVEAAAPGSTLAEEPNPALTVKMADFLYDMPETLPAGETVIKVVNNGPEAHEMNLLMLAEGKTVSDVIAYLSDPQGPPPFVPVGGMNGLNPGMTGYIEFNFAPGKYVAICNIPSPAAQGMPHFSLGMVKEITVP